MRDGDMAHKKDKYMENNRKFEYIREMYRDVIRYYDFIAHPNHCRLHESIGVE